VKMDVNEHVNKYT